MRTAAWLSSVLVACGASGRAAEPVEPPAPPAAPQPPLAIAAPVDAAPPPVEPPAPVDAPVAVAVPPAVVLAPLGPLPALYAELFEPRKRSVFRWKWREVPHDVDGDRVGYTTMTVTCTVAAVQAFVDGAAEVARLATVTCTTSSRELDEVIGPLVANHWLATADGLRAAVVTEDGLDLDGVRAEVAAAPPLFPAQPAAAETSQTVEGEGPTYQVWSKVFARGKGWCAEAGTTQYYGNLDRLCFEPRRGLVSWVAEGRSGPSDESYTRVR